MKPFGVSGATTTHGGIVKATNEFNSTDGKHHLREGDGFMCPKCKVWSTLIKSNEFITFFGKKVAFVGDRFTCGAELLGVGGQTRSKGDNNYKPALMLNPMEIGQSNFLDTNDSGFFSGMYQLVDEITGEPLKSVQYKITYDDGSVVEGTTNEEGETEPLDARKNQNNISIEVIGNESW
jgi:uncharacterized Zn-binding protein involved in type VI secretion